MRNNNKISVSLDLESQFESKNSNWTKLSSMHSFQERESRENETKQLPVVAFKILT